MKINPIRTAIIEPIKKEIGQIEALKQLKLDFLSQHGDEFRYFDTFRNRKSGVVAVLGYKTQRGPYVRSIAQFPDGKIIQSVATRNKRAEDGLIDKILKVTQEPNGKLNITDTIIHKLGLDTSCEKVSKDFVLQRKQCKITDFPVHLIKR